MSQSGDEQANYGIAHEPFVVTASRLSVSRRWSASRTERRDNGLVITGVAVSDKHEARQAGTDERANEFDLTIYPDIDARQRWEERARLIDLLNRGILGGTALESRMRELRKELLDKTPPTASLQYYSGWSLECYIGPELFRALVEDVTEGRMSSVTIVIQWAAPLIDEKSRWMPFGRTSWLLFKRSAEGDPEPLLGHVQDVAWRVGRLADDQQHVAVRREFAHACEEWTRAFDEASKEGKPWMFRCSSLIGELAKSIARWSDAKGETVARVQGMLEDAREFVQRLDEALHPKDGPYADETASLWVHRNLAKLYRDTKPSQREEYVDFLELSNLAREYVAYRPWLHTGYLNWLFIDALTAARAVAVLEIALQRKHGFSYAAFGGSRWKMLLWKITVWPLIFVFNWGLPAVASYFLARISLPAAIALAVLWYGLNLFSLAQRIWFRTMVFLSGKQTPFARMTGLVEEAEKIYSLLSGPLLHAGAIRAAFLHTEDRGAYWDQAIFYILDLVERTPTIWHNEAPRGSAVVRPSDLLG